MTIQNGRRWLRLGRKRRRCGFAHQQHDEISGGKRNEETDCFAWYHLEFHEKENPSGYIEIQKEDENGNDLAGAVFTAVNQSTNEQYTIGPTDAKGYAKSSELSLGTYVVTETTFPAGYEASDQTSWTVTISEDIAGHDLAVSQVTCVDSANMLSRKEELLVEMRVAAKKKEVSLVILMLTDVLLEGSQLLYVGDDDVISQAFGVIPKDNEVFLPKVMSRKKQIIPSLSALWG